MIHTIDFRGAKKDMLYVHPVIPNPGIGQYEPFVRLCLFHSLNRLFQNHARAIPALQSRRGRCVCPPLDPWTSNPRKPYLENR